jgi:hypothetical protein
MGSNDWERYLKQWRRAHREVTCEDENDEASNGSPPWFDGEEWFCHHLFDKAKMCKANADYRCACCGMAFCRNHLDQNGLCDFCNFHCEYAHTEVKDEEHGVIVPPCWRHSAHAHEVNGKPSRCTCGGDPQLENPYSAAKPNNARPKRCRRSGKEAIRNK